MDGEMPHLCLISPKSTTRPSKFRGPLWTEERYTSGIPVTASVFSSARGDFLVEIKRRRDGVVTFGDRGDGYSGTVLTGKTVLKLEVRAHDLRVILGSIEEGGGTGRRGGYHAQHRLLAPSRRAELCR